MNESIFLKFDDNSNSDIGSSSSSFSEMDTIESFSLCSLEFSRLFYSIFSAPVFDSSIIISSRGEAETTSETNFCGSNILDAIVGFSTIGSDFSLLTKIEWKGRLAKDLICSSLISSFP